MLYLLYVWKRVQDEIADEKKFAKKALFFFWFAVKDIKAPDIFSKSKNHQSVMGFSNRAQRFTTPYYLDVDSPLA